MCGKVTGLGIWGSPALSVLCPLLGKSPYLLFWLEFEGGMTG
ncbi:putative signal peptide protein [Puccinia sorghi]|uniref:Putative signal peptide protein n=1 Tax=Puccinia sorghi TaxID=27349 RepID=A0A0L6VNS5_9BASI|nr:putative signal peptide protein [Puccinia sorghi]